MTNYGRPTDTVETTLLHVGEKCTVLLSKLVKSDGPLHFASPLPHSIDFVR